MSRKPNPHKKILITFSWERFHIPICSECVSESRCSSVPTNQTKEGWGYLKNTSRSFSPLPLTQRSITPFRSCISSTLTLRKASLHFLAFQHGACFTHSYSNLCSSAASWQKKPWRHRLGGSCGVPEIRVYFGAPQSSGLTLSTSELFPGVAA